MKKYKVNDEFSILANLPHSFQITNTNNNTKTSTSYRLIDFQNDPLDPLADPNPIYVHPESNSVYILLYSIHKYMRLVYYSDDANGQIEMGLRTSIANEGLEFSQWGILTNGVPQEVISLAYLILTSPESVTQFEVPLFESSNNDYNNYNNTDDNSNIPSKPKKPNNTTPKKKKFKVRNGGSTQRRTRFR